MKREYPRHALFALLLATLSLGGGCDADSYYLLSDLPSSQVIGPKPVEITVNVTSNADWFVSSLQGWIFFGERGLQGSARGSGNGVLLLSVKENTTSEQRTGEVRFVVGSKIITHRIVQNRTGDWNGEMRLEDMDEELDEWSDPTVPDDDKYLLPGIFRPIR